MLGKARRVFKARQDKAKQIGYARQGNAWKGKADRLG
jgi:hypothetical protein